jgi:hypothetical protein
MRLINFLLLFFCALHPLPAQDGFHNSVFLNDQPYQILSERFPPPQGFNRVAVDSGSFGAWLRQLPLLPENAPVKDYRNRIVKKAGDSTVAAVVAYDIRGRNLEQCMDILMRLWAEYLSSQERQQAIQLPLPDGLMLSWTDWSSGKRPHFQGLNFFLVWVKPCFVDNLYRYTPLAAARPLASRPSHCASCWPASRTPETSPDQAPLNVVHRQVNLRLSRQGIADGGDWIEWVGIVLK